MNNNFTRLASLCRLQSVTGTPKGVPTPQERCSKRVAPNAEADGLQS